MYTDWILRGLLWGLLLTFPALADDVVLNWTAPTTRTDGSALSISEIERYLATVIDPANRMQIIDVGKSLSYQIYGLNLGGKYYFKVNTEDTDGRVSPDSDSVCLFLNSVRKSCIDPPTNGSISAPTNGSIE